MSCPVDPFPDLCETHLRDTSRAVVAPARWSYNLIVLVRTELRADSSTRNLIDEIV